MVNFPTNPKQGEIFFDKEKDIVYRYLGARDPKSLQLLPDDQQWINITDQFHNTNYFKGQI